MRKPITGHGFETIKKICALHEEANRLKAYMDAAYRLEKEERERGNTGFADELRTVCMAYEGALNGIENDITDVEAAVDSARIQFQITPGSLSPERFAFVQSAIYQIV